MLEIANNVEKKKKGKGKMALFGSGWVLAVDLRPMNDGDDLPSDRSDGLMSQSASLVEKPCCKKTGLPRGMLESVD